MHSSSKNKESFKTGSELSGKADLHVHTHFSDGIHSPEHILKKAADAGLKAISITDHDTIDAYPEARKIARELGVELVMGCEFSAHEGFTEYHILGYDFDPESEPLIEHLSKFRVFREERADKILDKLSEHGFKLDKSRLDEIAGDAPKTRPHIAKLMVEAGIVENVKQAFDIYLADGKSCNVEKPIYPVKDCIKLIHDAGGFASLAHPHLSVTESIVKKFKRLGLGGIEVVHPSHSFSLRKYYSKLSEDLWLLPTGGSDFHGSRDWDEQFGRLHVEYSVVESIRLLSGE